MRFRAGVVVEGSVVEYAAPCRHGAAVVAAPISVPRVHSLTTHAGVLQPAAQRSHLDASHTASVARQACARPPTSRRSGGEGGIGAEAGSLLRYAAHRSTWLAAGTDAARLRKERTRSSLGTSLA